MISIKDHRKRLHKAYVVNGRPEEAALRILEYTGDLYYLESMCEEVKQLSGRKECRHRQLRRIHIQPGGLSCQREDRRRIQSAVYKRESRPPGQDRKGRARHNTVEEGRADRRDLDDLERQGGIQHQCAWQEVRGIWHVHINNVIFRGLFTRKPPKNHDNILIHRYH